MEIDLSNRVAIVTGAGGGLGRARARTRGSLAGGIAIANDADVANFDDVQRISPPPPPLDFDLCAPGRG